MAVLQKIRQRSLLLILVIGFCLLAFIIGDLFNNGGFKSSPKDVGSVNGKDIPFEDFRIKVSNLEKSGQQGMTPTQAVNRVWDQEVSIALLTAEFDKLGLIASEKHILEVFKNDQNIGQNPMFQTKGVFDLAKFKEYFKSNPEQAQYLKDREKDADINAKYQIYNTLVKAGVYTTETEGKLKVVQLQMSQNASDYGKLNELTKEETALQEKLDYLMERWAYLEELAENSK